MKAFSMGLSLMLSHKKKKSKNRSEKNMKYKYDHIIKLLFEIHNWDKLPLYVPLNNKLATEKQNNDYK